MQEDKRRWPRLPRGTLCPPRFVSAERPLCMQVQTLYEALPAWSEAGWRARKEDAALAAAGVFQRGQRPGDGENAALGEEQPPKERGDGLLDFWNLASCSDAEGQASHRGRPRGNASRSVRQRSVSQRKTRQTGPLSLKTKHSASRGGNGRLSVATIRFVPPPGKPKPRSVAVAGKERSAFKLLRTTPDRSLRHETRVYGPRVW